MTCKATRKDRTGKHRHDVWTLDRLWISLSTDTKLAPAPTHTAAAETFRMWFANPVKDVVSGVRAVEVARAP